MTRNFCRPLAAVAVVAASLRYVGCIYVGFVRPVVGSALAGRPGGRGKNFA